MSCQTTSITNLPAQRGNLLSSLKSVLFVVGTAAIVFTAFRNTVTWHMQRFWGASGDFWQSCWEWVLDNYGDNDFNLMVYGTSFVTFLVYWGAGAIYTLFDMTGKPAFLRKYKIQPGMNEPVETKKVVKVVAQVLFNEFAVGIPFMMAAYYFIQIRGFDNSRELPTFHWVLFEMVIFILVEEIGFYYSHRFLHNRYLYKHIHKQHHEWTSPIAITAIYCHPIEHIFSNIVPIFLGVFVMGSHIATAWLWFSLAILSTLNAHCGYHFPLFPSPEAHDFHHLKFNQCYGVLGVLDRFHGTDNLFRASPQYQRHIMSLSTVSLREVYPDSPKEKSK